MQEQESTQELTHCYKNIITLKSSVQIEIDTRKFYGEIEYSALDDMMEIKGFINNPLLVEKTVKIDRVEIAAWEIIKDPCIAQVIPWPELEKEVDPGAGAKVHSFDCRCETCDSNWKKSVEDIEEDE